MWDVRRWMSFNGERWLRELFRSCKYFVLLRKSISKSRMMLFIIFCINFSTQSEKCKIIFQFLLKRFCHPIKHNILNGSKELQTFYALAWLRYHDHDNETRRPKKKNLKVDLGWGKAKGYGDGHVEINLRFIFVCAKFEERNSSPIRTSISIMLHELCEQSARHKNFVWHQNHASRLFFSHVKISLSLRLLLFSIDPCQFN